MSQMLGNKTPLHLCSSAPLRLCVKNTIASKLFIHRNHALGMIGGFLAQ